MDNKGANGKIYKLVSDMSDKILIGSTYKDLDKVLRELKSKHKSKQKYKRPLTKTETFYGLGKCDIVLIEQVSGNCNRDLLRRKRYHIKNAKNIYPI